MSTWKPIGEAARDVTDQLYVRTEHPIDFGKLAGVRKSGLRWVWRCGCDKCRRELTGSQGLHGSFRTRKAAERDCSQVLLLHYNDTVGSA